MPTPVLQEGTKNGCQGPQEQVSFPSMGLALHRGTKTGCSCSQDCRRRATHDGGVCVGTRKEAVTPELGGASRISGDTMAILLPRRSQGPAMQNHHQRGRTCTNSKNGRKQTAGACRRVWKKKHSSVFFSAQCGIVPPWGGRAAQNVGLKAVKKVFMKQKDIKLQD